MTTAQFDAQTQIAWQAFIVDEQLTPHQEDLFLRYLLLLQQWNEKMNLTRIIEPRAIIAHHFKDSLALSRFVSLDQRSGICDIGSGGGFPGIPLKIKYPQVRTVLIEVVAKKASFLRAVIAELGLEGIEVCTVDWRSMVNMAAYPYLDLFVARASLRPDELVYMFEREGLYRKALLVYWAAASWEMGAHEAPFFVKEEAYMIDEKPRRLIFFKEKSKKRN